MLFFPCLNFEPTSPHFPHLLFMEVEEFFCSSSPFFPPFLSLLTNDIGVGHAKKKKKPSFSPSSANILFSPSPPFFFSISPISWSSYFQAEKAKGNGGREEEEEEGEEEEEEEEEEEGRKRRRRRKGNNYICVHLHKKSIMGLSLEGEERERVERKVFFFLGKKGLKKKEEKLIKTCC